MRSVLSEGTKGVYFGLAAYLMWGFLPIYFATINFVTSAEIVAHRIIWTSLICLVCMRDRSDLVQLVMQPRISLALLVSSVCLCGNWLLFIWAVQNGHMLEASLGYFINPLITLVLSLVFLGERFKRMQWLAISLAVLALAIPLWRYGAIPWISLGLASSFAVYGLIRKTTRVGSLPGLCLETLFALPLAGLLLVQADSVSWLIWRNPWWFTLALIAAGAMTMIPLVCYVSSARRIQLSTLGMMQYLAPSIMFVVAIVGYGETVQGERLVTFLLIWVSLAIYTFDSLRKRRGASGVL